MSSIQIPEAKLSWIPESGLLYMGRSDGRGREIFVFRRDCSDKQESYVRLSHINEITVTV